jgi:RND superfamily putative drug exporter
MTVLVGGGAADVADVVARVRADFPRTALFIIVSTYLVLFVLLRSVVLPAKALVMNTLSIVASFGALVWIFQDGNLSNVLGFTSPGFTIAGNPIIMFSVLFGLSMDYEVFLLSRIREEFSKTGDSRTSVVDGLGGTARVITSAALIMISVFASFLLVPDIEIKMFAVGLTVAVLVDATIVRMVLVPATMELMGDANWWIPRWLDRILPKIDIEGTAFVASQSETHLLIARAAPADVDEAEFDLVG